MKTIYVNELKKFTIRDIREMRKMAREGIPSKIIAKAFNCANTTALWHIGDIINNNKIEII